MVSEIVAELRAEVDRLSRLVAERQQLAPTMTPETREELARAIAPNARDWSARYRGARKTADAIAPIVERLVAERVAAETERCAKAAFAELDCGGPEVCKTQQLKDGTCLRIYGGECGRDNAEDIAAAIRGEPT